MSSDDIRHLTTEVLKFNKIIPLKPTTIDDLMDKTSSYLKKIETTATSGLIKIKSIKLFKDQIG